MKVNANDTKPSKSQPVSTDEWTGRVENAGLPGVDGGQIFSKVEDLHGLPKSDVGEVFEQLTSQQKLLLAHSWVTILSIVCAASTVVTLSDGSKWWVTADRYGVWTAWNLCVIGATPHGVVTD